MKHNLCGYEWYVTPDSFLRNSNMCPKCNKRILHKTTEYFKQEVYELVNDEYTVLGEYRNAKTKILIRHNKCGYEWEVNPGNFLYGGRCPKCSNRIPYTTETFKERIKKLVDNEYDVLGEYKNNRTKILIKHNKCGHEYKIFPDTFFTQGSRCPQCNESKGERKIRHWLENNDIKFEPQYTFDNLLSDKGNPLRFDFGVLNKNNNIKLLIEYDGEQHFKHLKRMMKEKEFETLQYHDQLKNIYCQQNNISLLRISYLNFNNIEQILNNYLAKVGATEYKGEITI